jgi:hypothetical protein
VCEYKPTHEQNRTHTSSFGTTVWLLGQPGCGRNAQSDNGRVHAVPRHERDRITFPDRANLYRLGCGKRLRQRLSGCRMAEDELIRDETSLGAVLPRAP